MNFGVTAAKALQEQQIDGFWANGMGAEVAVRSGAGTIVLDIRRGDGPKPCFNYTMASVAATDRLIEREPDIAAAADTRRRESPDRIACRSRVAQRPSDKNSFHPVRPH